MTRKEKKTYADELSAAFFSIETVLEVWGTNSTLGAKHATLEVTAFDLHSDWRERFELPVVLAPNAATELWQGPLPGQPTRTTLSEVPRTIVVSARLLDADGSVLGRYANWCVPAPSVFCVSTDRPSAALPCPFPATTALCGVPPRAAPHLAVRGSHASRRLHDRTRLVRLLARPEPFKYIHFPTRDAVGLQIDVSSSGERITLSAQKPIKGLILDVEGAADATWSDQAIDLVPDDPQVVSVQGLGGRQVLARFLGDGSA